MLVLSRRVNEKIVLPSLGVTLELLEVKGKRIRLGISAPDHVRITRYELLSDQPTNADGLICPSDSQFDLHQSAGI